MWSAGGDEDVEDVEYGRDVVARTSKGIHHVVDTRGVPILFIHPFTYG